MKISFRFRSSASFSLKQVCDRFRQFEAPKKRKTLLCFFKNVNEFFLFNQIQRNIWSCKNNRRLCIKLLLLRIFGSNLAPLRPRGPSNFVYPIFSFLARFWFFSKFFRFFFKFSKFFRIFSARMMNCKFFSFGPSIHDAFAFFSIEILDLANGNFGGKFGKRNLANFCDKKAKFFLVVKASTCQICQKGETFFVVKISNKLNFRFFVRDRVLQNFAEDSPVEESLSAPADESKTVSAATFRCWDPCKTKSGRKNLAWRKNFWHLKKTKKIKLMKTNKIKEKKEKKIFFQKCKITVFFLEHPQDSLLGKRKSKR